MASERATDGPKSKYNSEHPGLSLVIPGSSNEEEIRDKIKDGIDSGVTSSGNWFWQGTQVQLEPSEDI